MENDGGELGTKEASLQQDKMSSELSKLEQREYFF